MQDVSIVPLGRKPFEVQFTLWVYGSLVASTSNLLEVSLSDDAEDIHSPDFINQIFLKGSYIEFYIWITFREEQGPTAALFTEETEDSEALLIRNWVSFELTPDMAKQIGSETISSIKTFTKIE